MRRILAKALRLLEEGRLFESEVAVGGDGPGGQLAFEGVRKRADTPADGADEEAGVDPGASGATEPAPRLPRPGAAERPRGRPVAAARPRSSFAASIRACAARSSRRTASAGW